MMSMAIESRIGDEIQRPGFIQRIELEDSSGSSSIGNNSDSDSDDGEAESDYKETFDSLDALQQLLPIKRGVSKFYSGKSKSFTSLANVVSCSSIKEIVKPENALTRKRINLLAHSIFWEKNCNFPPINNGVGISKFFTNSIKSTSAISNESHNSDSCNSNASSPILSRPPLHPQSKKLPKDESSSSPSCRNFSPWRSFSLSDLQGAAATTSITVLIINKGEESH